MTRKRLPLALWALLVAAAAAAQPASIVKDIYPGSSPQPSAFVHSDTLVRSGALVYFTADAGGSGSELWKTDGTTDGTSLVADLRPEPVPNSYFRGIIENLTDVNGSLFFTTRSDGSGASLWKTDGTAAGTIRLLQVSQSEYEPGLNGLVNVGGVLFFTNRSADPIELWKSDGTPAGTVRIAAVGSPQYPFRGESAAVVVGNTLFFAAYDAHGGELWKSDGTEQGTGLVRDIEPGGYGSNPLGLTRFGNGIFFTAGDSPHGRELWKSDGTEAGTVLVNDIRYGPYGSEPRNLVVLGNALLFVANDGYRGDELWRTDGTEGGTTIVRDILLGDWWGDSSNPSDLTAAFGFVFFAASTGINQRELWKTDGTMAGTVMVADLDPGYRGTFPQNLTASGSLLFFTATIPARGLELFATDGTEAGTVVVRDISFAARVALPGGGVMFFGNDAGINHFDALWKSDGTPGGTVLVHSFDAPAGSLPQSIVALNSEAYFVATGRPGGPQVWKSNGTPGGTRALTTFDSFQQNPNIGVLVPGANHAFFQAVGSLWSIEESATEAVRLTSAPAWDPRVFAGALYFFKLAGNGDLEMWKSQGTVTTTQLFKSFPSTYSFNGGPVVGVGGTGFFIVKHGDNDELWKTDGTAAGTVLVKQLPSSSPYWQSYDMVAFNGLLYFRVQVFEGASIWRSDGTEAGTYSVIPLGGVSKTVVNGTLFFTAYHPMTGWELWKSDGTLNGTHLVKDIVPGTTGTPLTGLTALGNVLYFVADDGVHGAELWRSDGSDAGTSLVRDIRPGPDSSNISRLTVSGGQLFFSASDVTSGNELWKSDGTPGGTAPVKDINPGAASSSPDFLTDGGGTLFFSAFSPEFGRELWTSDGTPEGTLLAKDINPSLNNAAPGTAAENGGLLYFSAVSAENGRELWKSDGTPDGTVLVKDMVPGKSSSFPRFLLSAGGRIFLSAAYGALGTEPWTSDGTEAGTSFLTDIYEGSNSSSPAFGTHGGKIYLSAADDWRGRELWVSDGTGAGTTFLKDVFPGQNSGGPFGFLGAGPYMYFLGYYPVGPPFLLALWRTDGQISSTIPLASFNQVSEPLTLGSNTVFVLGQTSQGLALWKSDGRPAGTVPVTVITTDLAAQIGPSWRAGSRLLFFVRTSALGFDLWKSDGTAAGTLPVKSGLELPQNVSQPGAVVGDVLFFAAGDADHGIELWKSDGSTAGTVLVKDIRPGPETSALGGFLNVGGKLLLRANDGIHGSELWQSDGTELGTSLLQDVNPGPDSSWPGQGTSGPYGGLMMVAGDRVFFNAADAEHGDELWSMPMSAFCAPPPAPTILSSGSPNCGVTLDAGPGYAAYLWSTGETTRMITVSPSAATTYSVHVSNAAGCRSSASIVQVGVVNPLPVATISRPNVVCAGQAANRASVPPAGPGAKYEWVITNGTITWGAGSDSVVFTAGASGTVQLGVTVTSGAGCAAQSFEDIATVACTAEPRGLIVDAYFGSSDGNQVLEPGEAVPVSPLWKNLGGGPLGLTGTAWGLISPAGPALGFFDSSADYGSIAAGATNDCGTATGDCYLLVMFPWQPRPTTHWDAAISETLSNGDPAKTWTLHLGDSFTDVPRTHVFYRFVETLLHSGVTAGCGPGTYCPEDLVSRLQVAIFLARAQAGGDGAVPSSGTAQGSPYDCRIGGASLFSDIAPESPFCRHVHAISAAGVTTGCEPGKYCPEPNVTRAQLAMFIARAMAGSDAAVPQTYGPDPVTAKSYSCDAGSPNLHFTDVTPSDIFCRHTHYLWAKDVISGFPDNTYQPGLNVSRGAMAKFLSNGFGLRLYGP